MAIFLATASASAVPPISAWAMPPALALPRRTKPALMAPAYRRLGYRIAAPATSAAWLGCSIFALGTYKPHRIVHNTIGVLQASSVVPVVWAAARVLADASDEERLPHRRLNLALATACAWSCITVLFAPILTAATVRTVDPVTYPPLLRAAAAAVHGATTLLCVDAWRSTTRPPRFDRAASGFFGALLRVGAGPASDADADADASAQRAPSAEPLWSFLSLSFGAFSGIAVFAPFPLATVPSLLGKRLARAFGAWLWLSACVCFVLGSDAREKEAAGPSESPSGLAAPDGARLSHAVGWMATAHIAVAVARPILEHGRGVYPAAVACKPAVAASLVVYALAARAGWPLFAAGSRGPSEEPRSTSARC